MGPRPSFASAAGLGAAAVGVVAAHQVLLVLFLGVLVGILIDGAAACAAHLLGVSRRTGARLFVLVVAVGAVVALASWGHALTAEITELLAHAPDIYARAMERLSATDVGRALAARLPEAEALDERFSLGGVTDAARGVAASAAGLGLVGFVGLQLGLAPDRYVRWGLAMTPPGQRGRVAELGAACHRALQHWLAGRLVDMTVLMLLTGLGLWWLGIPFALPLAVTAGLLELVPYLGPMLSVFPAVLVALTQPEPGAVLQVVLLYGFLQLFQSYVVTPLIEQRSVHVPPALGLSAQATMAVLAGPLAVLLATPLTVVAIVVVQMWYLRDRLHQPIRVLGAPEPIEAG